MDEPSARRWRLTWREVRAVATIEALDGFRARRQLAVRALTPIVLFFAVLGITLALRGSDTVTHPAAYRIAVQGDFGGARGTLDKLAELKPGKLEFVASSQAKVATITDADAGMLVPDRLDQTLREGTDHTVPVELYEVTVNPPSRAGAEVLRSSLVDLQAQRVQGRLRQQKGADAVRSGFSPIVVNVERTAAGTRAITSQVIPGLVVLQAAMLVAGTANRLVSRRTRGLLMAQLVLPVSRRALAFSKGLGELAVGTLTALPVVAAILAFGVITTTDRVSAAAQLLATVVTMLSLFALTTALGIVIGTSSRTQEQVSLATGAALIVATLIAATVALAPVARPDWLNALPAAGSVNALREVLNGSVSGVGFVVATVSTLTLSFLLIAWAGRSLDAERMVMRNG